MRVDVYLNRVCILKSRTLAREACDRGKVTLNAKPAKGSAGVSPGDHIALDLGVRVIEIEVVAVPGGRVSKRDAPDYYTLLRDERIELD